MSYFNNRMEIIKVVTEDLLNKFRSKRYDLFKRSLLKHSKRWYMNSMQIKNRKTTKESLVYNSLLIAIFVQMTLTFSKKKCLILSKSKYLSIICIQMLMHKIFIKKFEVLKYEYPFVAKIWTII